MALLVECPQCKRRNSQKEKACKGCGFALAKHSGRVWWIDYKVGWSPLSGNVLDRTKRRLSKG